MSNGKKIHLAIVVCVSSLAALTFLDGSQLSETAKPPQLSAATGQAQQTESVLGQQDPHVVWEPGHISQLDSALGSKSESLTQTVGDGAEDCVTCLPRTVEFLSNPTQPKAEKIATARSLMQPASQAQTLVLVEAILKAHLAGDDELKTGLLGALGEAQTPESAATFVDIIAKGVSDLKFGQLPDELQFAIRSAIKLNPFPEATGRLLAEHYNSQASPEVAQEFENLQQPVMLSILAKKAYDRGELARTEELTDRLSKMSDPYTLDGLMLLGVNSVLPLDRLNRIAHEWAGEHSGTFNQERYAEYLSNFDTNVTQRSVAAFALAASQDSASALNALEKALNHETDPLVRGNLETAINLVLDRLKK